jgi:hypothetical protein
MFKGPLARPAMMMLSERSTTAAKTIASDRPGASAAYSADQVTDVALDAWSESARPKKVTSTPTVGFIRKLISSVCGRHV